jgi:hypothetical protein
MPEPVHTINVAAHRVFGSVYRRVTDTSVDRIAGILGSGSTGMLPRPLIFPFLDPEHGTTRSEADIAALFSRDPAFTYEDGRALNDIFEPFGIRFTLTGIVDDAIDSDLADFMSQPAVRGIARQKNLRRVLNVYFVRDIAGAFGIAQTFSRHWQYPSYAFVADQLERPSGRFAGSLITLAHELGHVLGLHHMPGAENVMYFSGTTPRSLAFSAPQIRIARQQAKLIVLDQHPLDLGEIARGPRRVRRLPGGLF